MSSGNTQRAGKSTRDRGNKSPSTAAAATTQSPKSATDGHVKPPDGFNPKIQPTPEQIRLAQIINEPGKTDDPDIQRKVQQVMEVTGQSSDAVVIALHDCDNDPTRAITMLIEGTRHEGEWETRGKKKKPRESGPKGDAGAVPANSNKENRGAPRGGSRGEGGPMLRPRGGAASQGARGPSQGRNWKNKEMEKNERNLEDGRPGDRLADGRPPRASRRGGRGGRGGGSVGSGLGRSSRTFQNRGYGGLSGPQEGFPQAMDTWTNNGGADHSRGGAGGAASQDPLSVGNWNDLAASEDWSEEDWTGQLETKVFTPSGGAPPPPAPPDTASIMQLLKEGAKDQPAPSAAPQQQLQQQQHQQQQPMTVAQFNQQATESIKAAVGVGSNSGSVSTGSYSLAVACSDPAVVASGATSKPGGPPPRTKTARVRVPPPSKIPESAVEMPEDAVSVSSLEVQFGGLEFGTDSLDFGNSSEEMSAASQASAPAAAAPSHQEPPASSSNYLESVACKGSPNVAVGQSQSLGGLGPQGPTSLGPHKEGGSSSLGQRQQQGAVLSGGRPPGIPALAGTVPKEPQSSGGPPMSTGVSSSSANAASQKVNSVMSGAEHLLLQSSQSQQAHSERGKSSASSAGSQPKMYSSQGAASSHRGVPQGLEGSNGGGKGLGEQAVYSSAGHQYGGSYPKGLAGSSHYGLASAPSQGFPLTPQHYYSGQQQQQPNSFAQQQSNGYQGPYQTSGYVSQQQGYSSKLAGSPASLGSHPGKDSALEAAAQQAQQQQQQQQTYENSIGSASGLPSGPVSTLATTASSLAGATATTSVLKSSMSATGKALPNMPPGVPTAAMLGHQYLVGNAAVPFYGLQQQPLYSYEDLHLLQSRMPPLQGYYDMQFQVPTTSLTGRDLTLNNMAYAEAKFGRGENSESSPGAPAPGGTPGPGAQGHGAGTGAPVGGASGPSQQAGQPFLNALPPGYGYYFPGSMVPGSIHHYGPPPIFPVPPANNAHGPTTSAQFQKSNAYGSHSFTSGGYESLTQTPDYAKGAYGAGSQGQAKGISGSLGTADASRHSRSHPHLAKSFEKPGFLAVTPSSSQQQPPPSSCTTSSSSYPQMGAPRASPPTLAKHPQGHHHSRQGYFWGN